MHPYRVLVIGGYGFFGSRLVERLARQPPLHITIAGRSRHPAQALVQRLQPTAQATLDSLALDITAPALAQTLSAQRPDVVVHTCGPFQGQDYRVAQACIEAGAHYIDLADGRRFVAGIGVLHAAAEAAGVLVTSGASSVPALSCAAADALAGDMARVHHLDIGISPGNRTERGLSTVQAILGYCGKPLPSPSGQQVFGWSGTARHVYPAPVGPRLLSPCDVPDLALLPLRYPGTPQMRFGAGLELPFLHRGMNAMALMARLGLVRDWARHARLLHQVADWFRHWGSDAGAMHVTAQGVDHAGKPVRRTWQLLATHGDGPYVPTLAASALVRRLAGGAAMTPGARPCLGLLSLQDFQREAQGLRIVMNEEAA